MSLTRRVDEQSILDDFNEIEIRGLACQNSIQSWQIADLWILRRVLLQLDTILGLENNEILA